MKSAQQFWPIWIGGVLSCLAFIHLVPFFIRHSLTIGGITLTDQASFVSAFVFAICAVGISRYGMRRLK